MVEVVLLLLCRAQVWTVDWSGGLCASALHLSQGKLGVVQWEGFAHIFFCKVPLNS